MSSASTWPLILRRICDHDIPVAINRHRMIWPEYVNTAMLSVAISCQSTSIQNKVPKRAVARIMPISPSERNVARI